jgi:hypothetical protein
VCGTIAARQGVFRGANSLAFDKAAGFDHSNIFRTNHKPFYPDRFTFDFGSINLDMQPETLFYRRDGIKLDSCAGFAVPAVLAGDSESWFM